MLATVAALLLVRLERDGPTGDAAGVALTERFIESMDAEIRQMGVSDPKLGRQVRSLVASLATRVALWRDVVGELDGWAAAAGRSLYRDQQPPAEALAHSEAALQQLWQRLDELDSRAIAEGRLQ